MHRLEIQTLEVVQRYPINNEDRSIFLDPNFSVIEDKVSSCEKIKLDNIQKYVDRDKIINSFFS